MLAVMVDPREEQRAWLQDALRQSGKAPTAAAIEGGLSPTTLTRFLNNPKHSTALSARTISVVEKVTGVRFGGGMSGLSARESEAEEYRAPHDEDAGSELLADLLVKNAELVPWVLKSRALETAGYLPGDVLFVDHERAPEAGDVVCVQVFDWSRGSAETIFRLWQPPYLVAMTSDISLARPLLYPAENLEVRGVVMATVRPRKPRAS